MALRTLFTCTGLVGAFMLAGCFGGGSAVGSAAARSQAVLPAAGSTQRDLFIADQASSVLLYTADIHQKNPPLLGEITNGVNRSVAVWIDGQGTLYVVNQGGSGGPSIAEYKRGATSPFKTITSGLRTPGNIAVDGAENLYVSDAQGSKFIILVYAAGATSPTRTIAMPTRFAAGGLALGPNGNLLVISLDNEHQVSTVFSIRRGTSKVRNLNLQGLPPGSSLGTDKSGYIYAGGDFGAISIYAPGSKTPARTINLNIDGFYTQMSVTADGTIYWPNVDHREMYEFAPGASQPTNVFFLQGTGIGAAVGAW